MKRKVGPVAVIVGLVCVSLYCYFIYAHSFARRQADVSADAAPAYAKEAMKRHAVGYGNAPYSAATESAGSGRFRPQGHMSSYGPASGPGGYGR